MVPYNLPNGKTVYIPAEKLLDLTDEDIQDYMADDEGSFVQDPFYESSIDKIEKESPLDPELDEDYEQDDEEE